jgi:hypothetical protein
MDERLPKTCLWVVLFTSTVTGTKYTWADSVFTVKKSAQRRIQRLRRDEWFKTIRPDITEIRLEAVPFRTSQNGYLEIR